MTQSIDNNDEGLKELVTSKIMALEMNSHVDVNFPGHMLEQSFISNLRKKWESQICENKDADDTQEAMKNLIEEALENLSDFQGKVIECNSKLSTLKHRNEHIKHELSRVSKVKEKLELLCRELQKQNKKIEDGYKSLIAEEKEKRQAMHEKFQKMIDEVNEKISTQAKEYQEICDENNSLREKTKSFLENYDLREKQFEKQLEAKDLAIQLENAKFKQQESMMEQAKEHIEKVMKEMEASHSREASLKEQLDSYHQKFAAVQETLTQSDTVFKNFKEHQTKLQKENKSLLKENMALKQKCNVYDKGIISEVLTLKEAAEVEQKKSLKLENLCRILQKDRDKYKTLFEGAGINTTITTTNQDSETT